MGLDSESIELTRLAGSLHDLGKLAIPEEILQARPAERGGAARARAPPADRLPHARLPGRGAGRDLGPHHHERWDGTGYPEQKSGGEIPLGARILFVADAYDAMTTDRVYRGRLSHDRAIAELERCAGTQFDPDVVAAFKQEFDQPRLELVVAESA